MNSVRRLGLFGGTFDPVHVGHLILAETACDQLRLDRLIMMPASIPPHKQDKAISAAELRLEMLRAALADNERIEVSDWEIARGGVSFTADTLERLRASFPDTELFLIVGRDNLVDMAKWRNPETIARLATVAYANRLGTTAAPAPAHAQIQFRRVPLEMPLLEISGRDIRARVAGGRSIRFLVPDAVRAMIVERSLYSRRT